MENQITVDGIIATTPRHIVTTEGLAITSFRIASPQRKTENSWVDTDTNWYTIMIFRQLAINAKDSLEKGQRVIVVGNLKVRDWSNNDRSGSSVEVVATHIGHDLAWGTAKFERVRATEDEPALV
jgi:single-strand DNA-binding protein